jgi:hypothetical protein
LGWSLADGGACCSDDDDDGGVGEAGEGGAEIGD